VHVFDPVGNPIASCGTMVEACTEMVSANLVQREARGELVYRDVENVGTIPQTWIGRNMPTKKKRKPRAVYS
jgi:hypothetical protein